MNKDLTIFANDLRILKLETKVRFLRDVKKYAILFDPNEPKDIPEYSVDERMGFYDQMEKYLFYNLRGHYRTSPKYNGALLSEKQIMEQAKDNILHNRIVHGLDAYLQASEKDKKQFERQVKKPKLFASFLRSKSVLDHKFR